MAIPKTMDEVIEQTPKFFLPEKAKGFSAVYQYIVTGEGGKNYYMEVNNGKLKVAEGKHKKPSITISCTFEDFLKSFESPEQAQLLFYQGKFKMRPLDLPLVMKFEAMFSTDWQDE